ncbi:tetratricopeptide repeat protein [bacterium]|nr:MAG: tetratricopeptide repeat protein [bacterium]
MASSNTGWKAACVIAAIALSITLFYGCSKKDGQSTTETSKEAATEKSGKGHFDKGVQLGLKKQHAEAIKEYEESIKINPSVPEPYNNLGFEYYDTGDYDKAIANQKKALELNPNIPLAYYGMALALEKKGEKKSAIENWQAFMKLSEPHSKWWMEAQKHIQALQGKAPAKKGKTSKQLSPKQ